MTYEMGHKTLKLYYLLKSTQLVNNIAKIQDQLGHCFVCGSHQTR